MVAMIRIQRKFPLDRVYGLLEPGPVVLLATAHKGRANVMAMSSMTLSGGQVAATVGATTAAPITAGWGSPARRGCPGRT